MEGNLGLIKAVEKFDYKGLNLAHMQHGGLDSQYRAIAVQNNTYTSSYGRDDK